MIGSSGFSKDISNIFVISFIIIFIGHVSLIIFGQEDKTVRVLTTVLLFLIILLLYSEDFFSEKLNHRLIRLFLLYFISLLPSLFSSSNVFLSAFKILDIFLIILIVCAGTVYFELKGGNLNVFKFILWYFVFQTFIALLGYFFDPKSIVHKTDALYIPSLSCNYPYIHSNSLGVFGSVVSLFMVFRLTKSIGSKLFNIILLIVGLSVLYLSSSRTSLISFVIAFVYLQAKIFTPIQKKVFFAIGVIVIIIFPTKIYDFTIRTMMKYQTEEKFSYSDNTADLLLSGRVSIWEDIFQKNNNILFGKGFGVAMKDISEAGNAHNSIMELLISSGVLSVFFWLGIWFEIFRCHVFLMKNKESLPLHPDWYYLSFCFLILLFVRSFANTTLIYFQLLEWLPISVFCLYLYSVNYVRNQIDNVKDIELDTEN